MGLQNLGIMEVQHSWKLFHMLTSDVELYSPNTPHRNGPYFDREILHIAECFGRTCDADVFLPALLQIIRARDLLVHEVCACCVVVHEVCACLVVVHEVCARSIQDVPKEPLRAIVNWA